MSSTREYMAAWREKNKERIRAYNAKYKLAHADRIREQNSTPEKRAKSAAKSMALYHKNKHKIDRKKASKRWAEWYRKNKAKASEYIKRWHESHPEARAAYSKKYFQSHAEEIRNRNAKWRASVGREYFREWEKKNPGKRTAYSNARRARVAGATFDDSAKAFYAFVRSQEAVECAYCGDIVSGRSAHIDHMIALSRGGYHVASNLRVSCKNCNLSKHDKLIEEWRPEIAEKVASMDIMKGAMI